MSDSTAARRYVVRRGTRTAPTSTTASSSSGSSLGTREKRTGSRADPVTPPEKPRVDRGPFAVKEFKNCERAVVRFFVSQTYGTRDFRRGREETDKPWYVVDADTWTAAEGTETRGYHSRDEAKRVARRYRDKYGAYTRSPF